MTGTMRSLADLRFIASRVICRLFGHPDSVILTDTSHDRCPWGRHVLRLREICIRCHAVLGVSSLVEGAP